MPTLWEQVNGWVCKLANKWAFAFSGRADVETDDLINSGYLALAEAVKTFKAEKGTAFTTWFTLFLKTAFLEVYGLRAHKNDPLHDAASFDAPIVDSSGKDITLSDAVADPRGEAAIADQEERVFIEQLHDALEKAMEVLKPEEREVLQMRYYDGSTEEETSRRLGISKNSVSARERKALRHMRDSRNDAILIPFIDFDYYRGVGYSSFQQTGASIQERYMMKLDREYERRQAIEDARRREEWKREFEKEMEAVRACRSGASG